MPRPCLACVHPARAAIDAALLAGESCKAVAARVGITPASIVRHRAGHVGQSLAGVVEVTRAHQRAAAAGKQIADATAAVAALPVVVHVMNRLRRDFDDLEATAKCRNETARPLLKACELVARMTGELRSEPGAGRPMGPAEVADEVALYLRTPEGRALAARALAEPAPEGAMH